MQDLSKPILIDVTGEPFAVHFQDDGSPDYRMRWSGKVYPVYPNGRGEWMYQQLHIPGNMVPTTDGARCAFEFTYCWRGVWEGRVYFKQEEYWCEDLSVMSDLWNELEKMLKQRIKDENPEYGSFDE